MHIVHSISCIISYNTDHISRITIIHTRTHAQTNKQTHRFKDPKHLIVRLKNIKNGIFSSVTHRMTVIKTLVNHIEPTVVNTQ